MEATTLRNWAGNYAYGAARLHRPGTAEELREIVAGARARGGRVRALGSRHSFNGVADTDGDLISLERMDRVLEIDRDRRTVAVEGGVRYGELCRVLHAEGFALRNLASLPHLTVAGACATATHGSGDRNRSLSTAVSAVEIVTADGSSVALSRAADGDAFPGAVVSLGALGIVTRLTLDLVPAFDVRQDVYENLSLDALTAEFDAVFGGGYSVSLFTDWRDPARFTQVWRKRRVDEAGTGPAEPRWFGATLATGDRHPIAGVSAENCTAQQGVPGPWHERLPHFRFEFTPSFGEELQSEYFVPRDRALAALRAVGALHARIAPTLFVSEVRTVAADDLWLSPCYGRDSVAIHFTWKPEWPAVRELLPQIEAALAPFDARPHWAKLFTLPDDRFPALYERLPDFRALRRRLDPEGAFRNALVDRCIGGGVPS